MVQCLELYYRQGQSQKHIAAALGVSAATVSRLLKRALLRKSGQSPSITVVEHSARKVPIDKHDAGRRYRAVFGRKIDWQPIGFEKWVRTVAHH